MALTAPPQDRLPIVISRPSGVCKGKLVQRLLYAHPDTFAKNVSHTTCKPRTGEVDGETYFYVSPSIFSSLVSQNAFVEYASFSGHYYGTSKQTIEDQTAKGLVVVLDIEIQGIEQIKANSNIDARYVFIKPPSFETLEARLRSRSTENEEEIQKRLAQAEVGLKYADTLSAHDKITINDDLDKAYEELDEFVYKAAS